MKRFVIRLRQVHEQTGLTAYAVAKRSGVAQNTVRKYVDVDHVIAERLESTVLDLAAFYGVDWRNPSIVEVVEDSPEEGQTKTLLALPA